MFDFMLVNGRHAWNLSTTEHNDWFTLDNASFHWALSEEMLAFHDDSLVDHMAEACLNPNASMIMLGHQPQPAPPRVNVVCCIC